MTARAGERSSANSSSRCSRQPAAGGRGPACGTLANHHTPPSGAVPWPKKARRPKTMSKDPSPGPPGCGGANPPVSSSGTGRGAAAPGSMSRRTRECTPSAPTSRSAVAVVPSANSARTPAAVRRAPTSR